MMKNENIKIILASGSPRRKELLEKLNVKFEVIVSDADETPDESKSFKNQLAEISMRKARAVFDRAL